MDWLYWSVTTVMGAGDASQVHTPIGYAISWLLILFGVAIVASLTGALVGFLIDYLLKEGQGMGASGYRDHIIVCGWNSTARELIQELSTDEYTTKIVVIHNSDKNPAGEGVYFVSGDITTAQDLKRAGVEDAQAAVVCPADGSNEADMRSILCVMAIESIAPQVRTVVEVNNPSHVEHFQRADADEILVSSQLVSRLMARSSLYPGLAGLVTDIVSGGEGSELYRVQLPDDYVGLSVDELSAKLRADHRATLLSVSRSGHSYVNPPDDFRLAQRRRPGRGRGVARHAGPAGDGPRHRQPVAGRGSARPHPGDHDVVAALPRHRQGLGGVDVRADDPGHHELECAGVDDRERPLVVAADGVDARHLRVGAPGALHLGAGRAGLTTVLALELDLDARPPFRIAAASSRTNTGSAQPSYTQRVPSSECSVMPTR